MTGTLRFRLIWQRHPEITNYVEKDVKYIKNKQIHMVKYKNADVHASL